jgi:uncharacterized repeat protein (TIGR01451 family)
MMERLAWCRRGRSVRWFVALAVTVLIGTAAPPADVAGRDPESKGTLGKSRTGAEVAEIGAAAVAPGFQDAIVISGLTYPTVVRFSPDGRVFVAEKSGLIKVFDGLSDATPETFADLRTNVHNFWDRGLLGLALHPAFPQVPYLYALYTHDAPVGGAAPRWGTAGATSDGCPSPPGATTDGCVVSARLSRLQASGNRMTGAELPLIEDWCQQFPSHSIGDLRFGPDGALYATGGDGASFNYADYGQAGGTLPTTTSPLVPRNPCGDPPGGVGGAMSAPSAEGGALRAQDVRTGSGSGAGYAITVAGLAPVAHWRLAESGGTTAADAGGANTGSYVGAPALGRPGLLTGDASTAVQLDGVDDEVRVPSSTTLNQITRLSIVAWINATDWAGNRRIVQKGRSDNQYRLLAEGGLLKLDVAGVGEVTAALPSPGARHNVVGTFDGTVPALRLYVDGVLAAERTTGIGASAATSTDPLAIGAKPDSTVASDRFRGVVDEVSVHAASLSASQVDALWRAGTTAPGTGPAEPTTLDGAVIRIDPQTGAGSPGNPRAADGDANTRRLIAHGLRNPFRLAIRPRTAEVWVGDVGWNTHEEIDRIEAPGQSLVNFGWPCYEGAGQQPSYRNLGLTLCQGLYADGSATAPYFSYAHASTVVPGETCPTGGSAISGLAFYEEGTYPSAYEGALFFSDYNRNCIWAMRAGADGLPSTASLETFVAGAGNPVNLEIGPGGDLFYVDFDGGAIHQVRYLSSNQPPTAAFSATPDSGPAPLAVTFDGGASIDPEGAALAFSWDLDADGSFDDATSSTTAYTYDVPGTYRVGLRVTDEEGASATATRLVSVANDAPVPVIDAPTGSFTWHVGEVIAFGGGATDAQDGTLPASALDWAVLMHHCATPTTCHTHPVQGWDGVASGTFVAPDHEYPSHLEIRLTATDSTGTSATTSVLLQPETVSLRLESDPTGLQLSLNGTTAPAPFSRTVIVGSSNSISAPSPQTLGGVTRVFSSWTDGGAASHNVTAGMADATYRATYTSQAPPAAADVAVTKSATRVGSGIRFTIGVGNAGPNQGAGVTVRDVLVTGVSYAASTTTQGSCAYAAASRTVTCALGTLAPGASATVTIDTTVTRKGSGWIDNTATVSSSTSDPDPGDNSALARIRAN